MVTFKMNENKKNIIWAIVIMAIVIAFIIGLAVYIVRGRSEAGARAEGSGESAFYEVEERFAPDGRGVHAERSGPGGSYADIFKLAL